MGRKQSLHLAGVRIWANGSCRAHWSRLASEHSDVGCAERIDSTQSLSFLVHSNWEWLERARGSHSSLARGRASRSLQAAQVRRWLVGLRIRWRSRGEWVVTCASASQISWPTLYTGQWITTSAHRFTCVLYLRANEGRKWSRVRSIAHVAIMSCLHASLSFPSRSHGIIRYGPPFATANFLSFCLSLFSAKENE